MVSWNSESDRLMRLAETISEIAVQRYVGWNYHVPTAQNYDRFIPYILFLAPLASSCQIGTGPSEEGCGGVVFAATTCNLSFDKHTTLTYGHGSKEFNLEFSKNIRFA
jgi:hypothetical protein